MPRNNEKIKIKSNIRRYAEYDRKQYIKYLKKSEGYYPETKDEQKWAYETFLLNDFKDALEFIIRQGYIQNQEIQEVKEKLFEKFQSNKFLKLLKKEMKDGNEIEGIELFPIVIGEILSFMYKKNMENLKENPNAEVYDGEELTKIANMIIKKPLKKLIKNGIPEKLAFDLLCVIPCEDALYYSAAYRIRSFYSVLYNYAAEMSVPFADIMKTLIKSKKYSSFILIALLERKEKFSKLSDSQKTLYLDITTWCFDVMENDLNKEGLSGIIQKYIAARKRDDSNGKDGNRRCFLTSLSAEDYPRISKMVHNIISDDESLKKYL